MVAWTKKPVGRTRALRRSSTHAERALWKRLRNLGIAGCKFRRQYAVGRYIMDFVCLEDWLVVEVDGGQHSMKADGKRTRWLESQGFRVMRFWNNEVLSNIEGVLQTIEAALTGGGPHPNPLPQAGEGANQA